MSCKKLSFKQGTKHKFNAGLLNDTSDDDSNISLISTDNEDSTDEECVYCCQPYKLDECGEQWIRCMKCLRWAHELCFGTEKRRLKTFTCCKEPLITTAFFIVWCSAFQFTNFNLHFYLKEYFIILYVSLLFSVIKRFLIYYVKCLFLVYFPIRY